MSPPTQQVEANNYPSRLLFIVFHIPKVITLLRRLVPKYSGSKCRNNITNYQIKRNNQGKNIAAHSFCRLQETTATTTTNTTTFTTKEHLTFRFHRLLLSIQMLIGTETRFVLDLSPCKQPSEEERFHLKKRRMFFY